MWIENETIKNRKKKSQTNSEKSTVSDVVHRIGANFTIVRQKQKNV